MYASQLSMKSLVGSNEKHIYVSLLTKSKVSIKLRSDILTRVPKNFSSLIEQEAELAIERQARGLTYRGRTDFNPSILKEAYKSCQQICADNAKVNHIAWGRRIDDLDTALADTVQRFSLDIQPFKELLKGMRMDTWKTRYDKFQELELYCYYVAGTTCLLTLPVLGVSPESQGRLYRTAISLGIGIQLTNILRDVVEDAALGRIYHPQEELREFGLTDDGIMSRNANEKWCELMKKQIALARWYFDQVDEGIAQLQRASRWAVCVISMLYQRILDEIDKNNYDNLTKQAHLGTVKKLLVLPLAYVKYMVLNQPL